ncbi:hypothetical protein NRP93_000533 [Clostridium botulinum]|nr:hypothetical protein [Clostridium botulinum]
MGNVKYSKIETSNGFIKLQEKETYEKEFDSYEYLKIYNVTNRIKVYINNSIDYIYLLSGEELILQDFSINSIKIEFDEVGIGSLMYYVCK